jgi:hypothetical protein
MTEVLLTCTRCNGEIAVDMDVAILRMDEEPKADGELLFCCPTCGAPGVRHVVGELLTLLLLVGVEPLRFSEPSPEATGPGLPALTLNDLIEWHEQLASVQFITPWEL